MSHTPGAGRRRSGPSIDDVARLAGVSSQTVSRVSTGAERVRPETRDRVIAAMDQLGYSPNRTARALRSGSFDTIGLIAHQIGRTGEALTTEAVVDAAEQANHTVTLLHIHDTEADTWRQAAGRLSDQAIDALIIIRAEGAAPETLALPSGLPVVVSDSRLIGHFPGVVSDQLQGTRDAVRHLLELGHSRIHHIAGPADSDPANVRLHTWQRELSLAGIRPPKQWQGDWTAASGYAAGLEIAADPEITAVFAANDEMAFGLLRALHEAGRRVPEDVSVVGFDDIALAAYASPALTTVKQDWAKIGNELVRIVLGLLDGTVDQASSRIGVPTELIVRASTAPPRR